LARRIVSRLQEAGLAAFEHKTEFPLNAEEWVHVGTRLQSSDQPAVLLIDDAAGELGPINRIANKLEADSNKYLRVILTAHVAQWVPRSKSSALVRLGQEATLSTLSSNEVEDMVTLYSTVPAIRDLVKTSFRNMPRNQQVAQILSNSKSDMFVALKFCFPGENLDRIILEEFSHLNEVAAEVYRYVSLVEAAYGRPSRQLILEALGLGWENIPDLLRTTKGIIVQRLTDARDETYSWSTRHPVIAETINHYKWYEQDDLRTALSTLIASMNAAQLLDRQLIPHLCDSKNGIGRLDDARARIRLYQQLTELSSNRVPWHRMISAYLSLESLDEMEACIRSAELAVGTDSPIHRYKVLLLLKRAADLKKRLRTDDFVALLYNAWGLAQEGVQRWSDNKHSYLTLADVAEAIAQETGKRERLKEVHDLLQTAYDDLLDVELLRRRSDIALLLPQA